MYTKHVFKKIAKIQRSYVPLCGHTTFELLTSARTMTIINKITIFCNDVNKSSTSIKLLAINILHYMSYRSNVGLWNWVNGWTLNLHGLDITPLCIHLSLINCFNKVIFLCFYNELKFYILSRDGKMLGLSPGVKISISSKSGALCCQLSKSRNNHNSKLIKPKEQDSLAVDCDVMY